MSAYAASRDGVLSCLGDALRSAGIDLDAWPDGLGENVSLDDDLGLDSFQLMAVARHLETAYAFQFSVADWALAEEDAQPPGFLIGSLLDFVLAHLAAPGG